MWRPGHRNARSLAIDPHKEGISTGDSRHFALIDPLCERPGSPLDLICVVAHFVPMALPWSTKMATYSIADCEHSRGDEAQLETSTYRFGRRKETSSRIPAALRATSYLKNLIRAIADAKFRRMLRELELRGGYLDRRDELWTPDAPLDRATIK